MYTKYFLIYAFGMYMEEFHIVFPEGDSQEINGRLRVNQVVDVNGSPIPLPLPTNKMIAFRVARIQTQENKGSSVTYHYLELLNAMELMEFCE